MRATTQRLPPITLLAIIVEFVVIIVLSINASAQFLIDDPNMRLPGHEAEWLTSSVTLAARTLHDYGDIPMWEPYFTRGEPLIDNPFGFVLNPLSAVPSFIFQSNIGIRYSVVLYAVFAGLGGWALGRMLGFGSLGRVLLGLLMAGKGNMVGMIGAGYFQLGVSQAYIPWVLAGTIGILRLKHQRLSVILTAAMLTLMFFAGNIYFLLPTLISVAGVALTHIIDLRRIDGRLRLAIDQLAFKRLALSMALTVGLSAVTLLPLFLHQSYIGGHPNEQGAGTYADLTTVIGMFFSDSPIPYDTLPGGQEFYQSFILPLWFAVAALVAFPLITFVLARLKPAQRWKVAIVALFMIVFCTFWGTGQNPIIAWMYAHLPLIGQWRFVGRILGIVTFWLAVLAVMQVDNLWFVLTNPDTWKRLSRLAYSWLRPALKLVLALSSLAAASQVLGQWTFYAGPAPYGLYREDECIDWLRDQNPGKYLSVWTLNYAEITVYLLNDVRHANIAADFFIMGSRSTLFDGDLTRLMPEYGTPWSDNDRAYMNEQGYHPVAASPLADEVNPCLWQKDDAHAYAFTVPLPILMQFHDTLPAEVTTPVSRIVRYPDQVGMLVDASPFNPLVVTVQEVSYPGWIVEVDHQPARLESVGGLLGVVLPPGEGTRAIYFAYHPPLLYLGGFVTLVTALFCALYLLRVERFIPKRWISNFQTVTQRAGQSAQHILLSPQLFEPHNLPSDLPLLTAPKPDDQPDEAAPIDGEVIEESEPPE